MSQFIDERVMANFPRLRRESATYLTDAGEDPPALPELGDSRGALEPVLI
jgi:hypothetical protein